MSTTNTCTTEVTQTSCREPEFTKLELVTAQGPVYRLVSSAPPRDAEPHEVPVIDLSGIWGDGEARQALAAEVRTACQRYGFFYIRNHGIPAGKIDNARRQALKFFHQPIELKDKASDRQSKYYNGWSGLRSRRVSPTESADKKEGFIWSYDPVNDPEPKDMAQIPSEVVANLHAEEFLWQGTAHLPGFREGMLSYWKECNHFDHLVTFPGADGAINHYPASNVLNAQDEEDQVGGLQVLSKSGQWLRVPPMQGTLVVNIGDYLMRLTNDRFVSTVHRVFNRAPVDRLSMPFFFGFNFNETLDVLPSCIDETHPARYEPISCGEWCKNRLAMVRVKKSEG